MNSNILILFILITALTVMACEKDASASLKDNELNADLDLSSFKTEMSKLGHYRVSIRSEINPLPMNQIHKWILHAETADGKIVEQAKIAVYGGMPAHKHGFPTQPRVTRYLGGGNYIIDGIKFSMPGLWEIWLNITANGRHDKVIFKINMS